MSGVSSPPSAPADTALERELRKANQALLVSSIHQHELTEQAEKAETALRESESQLRLAQEGSHTGIWTWDGATDRVTWSRETYALFGIDPQTPLLYESWREVLHPDDREQTDAAARGAMAPGGSAGLNVEYRIYHSQRGLRWLVSIGQKVDPARPRFMTGITLDITERKQAEAAVRRSEAKLRDFLENAPVGIHWVGADGMVLWVNQAELDLLGYTRDEFVGRHVAQFHADQPVIEEMLARLAHGETLQQYEARMRAKDGSIRHVLINSNALFEDGKFVRTRCFLQDITERRLAEQAMRESEQRYRLLFDLGPVAIYSIDVAGTIQAYNRRAAELWGRAPALGDTDERFCGSLKLFRPDGSFMPHQDCPMAEVVTGKITEARDAEVHIERPDGSRVTVIVNIRALKNERGETIGAINCFYDITERKRSEQQLRRNAETFSTFVEQSPFGIYTVDSEFRIAQVSAGAEPAFRNVRPLIGRDFGEAIRIIWPEPFASQVVEIFRHTLQTEEPYLAPSLTELRRDVPVVESYEWQIHRVTLPDGRYGIVCYFFDATRLREAENALREADRRKDEFLAMLAHELRNPLAAISNAIHLSRESDLGDRDQVWVQEILDRQLDQLARLVDDLLDVSRITHGRIILKREILPLATVVNRAVESLRPRFKLARHKFMVETSPEILWVDADQARLEQVLVNLLSNTVKYTPEGGQVWLQTARDGGDAVITVRDTGIGISREMLPKVFDMFAQAEQGLSRSQGGLGIGLTLVRRLVELHGGYISVNSPGAGQGSTFTVRLPLVQPAEGQRATESLSLVAPGAPMPATNGPVRQPLQLLVVDDNRDAAQSLARLLKISGHQPQIAYDGAEALAAAVHLQPQLGLLDLGLPGMDGYELARRLKTAHPRIYLVAISGYGQAADREQAKAAGFDEHFVKPVSIETLLQLIEEQQSQMEMVGA